MGELGNLDVSKSRRQDEARSVHMIGCIVLLSCSSARAFTE